MIDNIIMKRFKKAYSNVYGTAPAVKKQTDNGYYDVHGIGKAHLNTLLQIAMYYNWCHKHSKHPDHFSTTAFQKLQSWYNDKKMNQLAVALILKQHRIDFRECMGKYNNDIYKSYVQCRRGGLHIEFVEHKNERLTVEQWAEKLEMSKLAFNVRRRKHGDDCYLTFLTKEKYKKVSNTTKKRLMLDIVQGKKEHGNKEWQSLDNKKKCKGLNGTKITFKQCNDIIAAMIHDAKVNLVKRNKTFFNQSQNFLMNTNGGLEHLLESIDGIDVDVALAELKYFARESYRHCIIHQNTVVHRDSVQQEA